MTQRQLARRSLAAVLALACFAGASLTAARAQPNARAPRTPTVSHAMLPALSPPTVPDTQTFARLSLPDALTAAVANSPDVAGARARYEQSRYGFLAARDGLAPSLTATYAQVPQGNPPGPNILSRQLTVGLQWTIGDFLAYTPAVREAALALSASEFDQSAAVAAEKVKVVGLYLDALKARAISAARQSALGLAVAQYDAARVRLNAGVAPQLDIVRADVAAAKAQADLESARAADLNATEALRVETGVGEAALATTAPAQFAPVNPTLTDPTAVVALARTSRPEIASAQRTAQAASAAVRSARAAGLPVFTVSGGYLVGTDSGVPVKAPAINANLAVRLSRAAQDRVDVAAARATEAQTKAAGIERQILLDAAASARSLGAAQRATAATTRGRQSAEAELRATDIGYRSGASSSLELTTARATYTQAIVDELSTRYDLEKARARLNIEVGR